ncbi:MAG: lysozyme inhibitor LprI family protein [Rhizobiaceae bacterium]
MAGEVSAQDIDCSAPSTQIEMTSCAGLEWEAADAELNAIWDKALAIAEDEDAFLISSGGDNRPGYVETLRNAQRAWIDFRDFACEFRGFQARGGSMESMLVNQCLAEMTKERTIKLQAIVQEMGMQ